jgi:predicted nucleic acid-binding protein
VPLLVAEPTSGVVESVLAQDPLMLVWWATEVECASAIARLEREDRMSEKAILLALRRLDALAPHWHEVQPVQSIRATARRLLRTHGLRAADALQLAAAIIATEGNPASLDVVTHDDRLTDAARREGFNVIDCSEADQ